MRTVGWERALKMGSPDWVLGLDAPNNIEEQQALTAKLATLFKENPTAVKTQVPTLSLLLQQANTACHDHGDQDQSAHAAMHENPRKIAECIVNALAAGDEEIRTVAKPPVVNLSTFNSQLLDPNALKNAKDVQAFNVMALLADRYKTPFTWGAQEMAKTVLYPEKSVLKSKLFNRVAACVIAVSGTWGIGQRVAEMLHPQPEPTPITQLQGKPPIKQTVNIPEAAEQASLFVGAYLLGLYFSLSWSKQKLSPQQQQVKLTALAGHISSEAGLTAANVFSAAAEGMRGVWDAVVTKQITDSILDVVLTGTTVNVAHNCLESSRIPSAIQDKIKHQAAAVLSVFAAVGAHDTLGFMQNTLLPLYAGAYGVFGVYKGAQYVAKNIEKPKFWQKVGVAAASLMMTFNMTGSMPLQRNAFVDTSPIPVPMQRVAKQQPTPVPTVKQAPSKTVSIAAGSSFNATLGKHLEPKMVAAVSAAFGTPDLVQAGEKITLEQQGSSVRVKFRGEQKSFAVAKDGAVKSVPHTSENKIAIKQGSSFSETLAQRLSIKSDSKQMQGVVRAFGTPDLVQFGEEITIKQQKEGLEVTFRKQQKIFNSAGEEILPKVAQSTFWAVGRGGTLTQAMQTTLAKAGLRNDAAFAYRALKEFQKHHSIDIDSVQPADATALVRNKDSITLYLKKDGEVYSRTITEKPKQAEGISPVMTLMQQVKQSFERG